MAGLFLSPPYIPPPPPVIVEPERWVGLRHVWTGANGSEWDLSNPDGGVFLTQAGVRGLGMPDIKEFRQTSPGVAGARRQGSTTQARSCLWPLYLFHDAGSDEWIDLNRNFWESIHPETIGTWSVYSGTLQTRRDLRLQFSFTGDQTHDIDPTAFGWSGFALTSMADQPYWSGEIVTRRWQNSPAVDFFGPTGFGPPFYISPGATLETAQLTNEGDVEAPVVWTVYGPNVTVTVGVEGRVIEVPFEVPDGRAVVLDPRNTEQSALLYDVVDKDTAYERFVYVGDVTADLGDADWQGSYLRSGADVDLALDSAGTGQIKAEFTPLYYRAF